MEATRDHVWKSFLNVKSENKYSVKLTSSVIPTKVRSKQTNKKKLLLSTSLKENKKIDKIMNAVNHMAQSAKSMCYRKRQKVTHRLGRKVVFRKMPYIL